MLLSILGIVTPWNVSPLRTFWVQPHGAGNSEMGPLYSVNFPVVRVLQYVTSFSSPEVHRHGYICWLLPVSERANNNKAWTANSRSGIQSLVNRAQGRCIFLTAQVSILDNQYHLQATWTVVSTTCPDNVWPIATRPPQWTPSLSLYASIMGMNALKSTKSMWP